MSDPRNRSSAVSGGWRPSDILRDIAVAWQLIRDPAVPSLLKMTVPLFALLYWLSPVDILTGLPFDDLAVIVLAARLFVQMAPRDAVERALRRLYGMSTSEPDPEIWNIWEDDGASRGRTIDGQWRVVDDSE